MFEQIENHGRHLKHAIDSTTCTFHQAQEGTPCWVMYKNLDNTGVTGSIGASGDNSLYASICGKRIRKAGFVGRISAASMRLKSSTPDTVTPGGPRRSFAKKTTDTRPARRENSK